jgi:2-polyprenyl-3-methyl-5-hydroxy-6-metoxy-1,4-benzoquinol methylase
MKQYYFYERTSCEMCGSPSADHKIKGSRLNTSQGKHPRKKKGIAVTVQQCSDCGLIYSNPLPIPANINDHYNVPPESYWREAYFKVNKNYYSKEIEIFRKLANFQPGMKALDVGAGLGRCMLALQEAGFDTYGFEPSETFFERAISKMGVDPQRLKLCKLEDVEYDPEMFDFISFGAVFEHLYHPFESLSKAMKWLKPGGLIQMEVPSSKYLMARLINVYNRLCGTNYTTHLSPMLAPYHLYEFTVDSFKKAGEKLGYEVVLHYIEVCEILHFPSFTHPFFKRIMKATNTGMQLMIWLRKTP